MMGGTGGKEVGEGEKGRVWLCLRGRIGQYAGDREEDGTARWEGLLSPSRPSSPPADASPSFARHAVPRPCPRGASPPWPLLHHGPVVRPASLVLWVLSRDRMARIAILTSLWVAEKTEELGRGRWCRSEGCEGVSEGLSGVEVGVEVNRRASGTVCSSPRTLPHPRSHATHTVA